MIEVIPFPAIDPVMVHIGPVALHWYGMAYVVGIIVGWQYAIWLVKRFVPSISKIQIDDFMMWALAGIIIGGRLGHILFFEPMRYLSNPLEILMTWKGGMAFHGGLLGVVVACIIYCHRHKITILRFGDVMASIAPIGLLLGRLANFINAELYGRVTDVPWGMVFPNGGPFPRHPSQLYEAFFEGAVLFILLHVSWRIPFIKEVPGRIFGLFLLGYGLARTMVEFVREPDTLYGIMGLELTTGQLLSIPLVITGIWLMVQKATLPNGDLKKN
jgi:phosphatidylglycerol---prolipoprotein diacylglyceryl transferase